MKRKIIGIILVLTIVIAVLPVTASPMAKAAPTATELAAAYAAYYEVLMDAVEKYGIGFTSDISEEDVAHLEGEYEHSSSGLIYAELIDFENSGMPQLLFFHGSYGYLGYYYMYCPVYTFSAGKATELGKYTSHGTTENFDDGSITSRLFILKDRSGVSYLRAASNPDYENAWDYYYTVKNGELSVGSGEGVDIISTRELTVSLDSNTVNEVLKELQSFKPSTPPPQGPQDANPSAWSLNVDGGAMLGTDMYTILGNNYLKIRDIAALLDGTEKQFDIIVNGRTINMIPGEAYKARGDEMTRNPNAVKTKTSASTFSMTLDGEPVELTAYMIAGSNYVRLRDVLRLFDVYVSFDSSLREFYIDTSRAYEDS